MIRAVGRALAIFDAYDNEHLSLSLQEIADELGISKESAQTHLARARTALIAVLDQEDAR